MTISRTLASTSRAFDDKTEYQLVVSSQNSGKVAAKPIQIGESKIPPTPSTRNIGIMFDENMNLDIQIKKVCQACLFWLRNIRKIKRCLTVEFTKAPVQSLVLSRLNYCNSLYHGLPKFQISKLQRIQNSSVRLITCTPYHEHIKPVLMQLHWLPVLNEYNLKCFF